MGKAVTVTDYETLSKYMGVQGGTLVRFRIAIFGFTLEGRGPKIADQPACLLPVQGWRKLQNEYYNFHRLSF